MQMPEKKFLVLIRKAYDTGDYCAEVPELPGCVTQSDTRDELKEDIREAMSLYLEDEPPMLMLA